MATLGDIVNLLEKIPIWKRLRALPDQFEALQARVSALEEELRRRPTSEHCPICQTGELKVIKVEAHPYLGAAGLQERVMKCDNPSCGHTENRIHDPQGKREK